MRTIEREIVGAFIISSDNHLLLGKSYKGGVYNDCWIVPGGGIESSETEIQAVCRETLEEVGIDISNWKIEKMNMELTGESEKVLRDTNERVIVNMQFYNFIIRAPKPHDRIKIVCDDDIVEARWHSIDTLTKLKLSPPTRTTLEKIGLIT